MPVLTRKGQVTIPKQVREALGLKDGDTVVFELRDREAVIRKIERKSILEVGGIAGGARGRRGG